MHRRLAQTVAGNLAREFARGMATRQRDRGSAYGPKLGVFTAATLAGGGLLAYAAHKPALAESQDGAKDETLTESVLRLTGLAKWVDFAVEPADRAGCPPGKLLPDPPPLPPGVVQRTLVLSLEDCIIHTEWERKRGHRTKKRPGLEAFLAHISQFYEIVLFTTTMSSYGQPIANSLQETGYVQHALFRESCKYTGGRFVKDLSYLNRDLRHVIIVDTNPDSYANQPKNAILIKNWSDDLDDTQLLELVPFLEAVFREDIHDVREVLSAIPNDQVPEKFRELKHQCLERKRKGATPILGRARAPAGVLPVLSTFVPNKPAVLGISAALPVAKKDGDSKKEGSKAEESEEKHEKPAENPKKNIFAKAKGLH